MCADLDFVVLWLMVRLKGTWIARGALMIASVFFGMTLIVGILVYCVKSYLVI